ncbi:BRO1 domain-containing protein [Pediococcus pentosaceus]|uniref:hypothetical protein n=1 Tax=Pediococcus pentosaceus TaxID=1255 RepID=UPI002AB3A123|nr:hypothetical protein [Pediococcus pentosaceus]MDY8105908.1 hypothetical protein [Pediococcus pentosaceus]
MTVINLDTIKQPVAKQVQFDGKKYNLVPDDDLDDLIEQMEAEQARVLGDHREIVKTSDKADKLQNASSEKMLDFYNKHAKILLQEQKSIATEMQAAYVDFFDSALLDEDNEECEAGKLLAKFWDNRTVMLATFYNKISAMRQQEQAESEKQFNDLTQEALGKADKVTE